MGARAVLEASSRMRFAKSFQLIGSGTLFTRKIYMPREGTREARPATLPEAFLLFVEALLGALLAPIAAFFTLNVWAIWARRYHKSGFVAWARTRCQLPYLMVAASMIAASPSAAQLTIVNPKQLEVPEEKANVLLSTACRVVAQEFQVSDPSALKFSLVLALGEKEEHYTVDEKRLEYKVYMKEWDETRFAALAMRLCVQQLPTHEQEARLLKEIVRRSDKISPVPANKLRRDAAVPLPPRPRSAASDCMSAAREQPCQRPGSAP